MAMVLVLVLPSRHTLCPTIAGLYGGGAGEDGRYQMWGIEEYESGEGIAPVLMNTEFRLRMRKLGVWIHPARSVGNSLILLM